VEKLTDIRTFVFWKVDFVFASVFPIKLYSWQSRMSHLVDISFLFFLLGVGEGWVGLHLVLSFKKAYAFCFSSAVLIAFRVV
jgi:hypothetical protein